MPIQELYHGAEADEILSIIKEGLIRPHGGEIYFGKQESQYPALFQYGADTSRGARFVIKLRVEVPDACNLRPFARHGAPRDAWKLETNSPLKAEVLRLFVQQKPGSPIQTFEGSGIADCLHRKK